MNSNLFVPLLLSTFEEGKVLEINTAFTEFFGFSSDEILARRVVDLGLWIDLTIRESFLNRVRRMEEVRDEKVRLRAKSGKELEVRFTMLGNGSKFCHSSRQRLKVKSHQLLLMALLFEDYISVGEGSNCFAKGC